MESLSGKRTRHAHTHVHVHVHIYVCVVYALSLSGISVPIGIWHSPRIADANAIVAAAVFFCAFSFHVINKTQKYIYIFIYVWTLRVCKSSIIIAKCSSSSNNNNCSSISRQTSPSPSPSCPFPFFSFLPHFKFLCMGCCLLLLLIWHVVSNATQVWACQAVIRQQHHITQQLINWYVCTSVCALRAVLPDFDQKQLVLAWKKL